MDNIKRQNENKKQKQRPRLKQVITALLVIAAFSEKGVQKSKTTRDFLSSIELLKMFLHHYNMFMCMLSMCYVPTFKWEN